MNALRQIYDSLSIAGIFHDNIPEYIEDNLNSKFKLRKYQEEAIFRFIHYVEKYPRRLYPSQLLFHMATGSGKTILMAAFILYLYNKGYRNFLFFVNSNNIIEKTKENFLNYNSSKYLFNQKIEFEGINIKINQVNNFDFSNQEDINILFTTIQGLYSSLNTPKENVLTYEDFKDEKLVIISDEAHHINAWTRNKLSNTELTAKNTWEYTVTKIFNSNSQNIMLEFTATVDLEHPSIKAKYDDKLIYEYSLKQFRQDGYSKEVKVLQSDYDNIDRMLQAIILSQYRRKIAAKNKINLKPIILFKSKSIIESKNNFDLFLEKIKHLKSTDLHTIKQNATDTVIGDAFHYFENEDISIENLIIELKEDFSDEKCMLLDSNNIDEYKQISLNSLEDKNNEIRAIFAVNMLNEGWDVLNLFDIVRLYESRDGKWLSNGTYQPGKTTLSEVQLIGRGARYYPFKLKEDENEFKRKYDQKPDDEIKVLEELYYHSSYIPRYLSELKFALIDSGIMPPNEPRTLHVKVKDDIKNTDFWKNGFIFINKKIEADRSKIKDIDDINIKKIYGPINLRSGYMQDKTIFIDDNNGTEDKITKTFELKTFNEAILKKALNKIEFYKFSNLLKFFPNIQSINEFIKPLKEIKVDVRSSKEKLENLTPQDKLNICITIFKQLEIQIKAEYTEYKGTHLFVQNKVEEIVKDKVLNINVKDGSDQEFGNPMSNPVSNENLKLNLKNKNWYIYDENYGTSEEKSFIQFINGTMENLEKKFSDIYLLRNENLFKIFRFSDGKATMPDFVLFLKENSSKAWVHYQVFIEPKAGFLKETDKWKEDFLKEIEDKFVLEILAENTEYKLLGLPFYIESSKQDFINSFNDKLNLN